MYPRKKVDKKERRHEDLSLIHIFSWGGSPWWSWVITSAFVGVVIGLFAKKLDVQEGEFGKGKVAVFVVANVIAHVIGWVVVAPVLDILIYAEPANKVFAQGVFAAVSNTVTGVIVGGLLVLAYTKTIACLLYTSRCV